MIVATPKIYPDNARITEDRTTSASAVECVYVRPLEHAAYAGFLASNWCRTVRSNSLYFLLFQDDTDLGPVREIDFSTFAEDSSSYLPAEPVPATSSGARSRVTFAAGATSNNGNFFFAGQFRMKYCVQLTASSRF